MTKGGKKFILGNVFPFWENIYKSSQIDMLKVGLAKEATIYAADCMAQPPALLQSSRVQNRPRPQQRKAYKKNYNANVESNTNAYKPKP